MDNEQIKIGLLTYARTNVDTLDQAIRLFTVALEEVAKFDLYDNAVDQLSDIENLIGDAYIKIDNSMNEDDPIGLGDLIYDSVKAVW